VRPSDAKHHDRQSVTTLPQREMDLASIRRRGTTWQAQVRRQGFPSLTRTFHSRVDAKLWARQREAELDRGYLPRNTRVLRSVTLGSLLERYRDTVTPRKRGANRELYKLRVLLRHPMAQLSLDRLNASEIAAYRDERLAVVKADTVRREMAILHHCLKLAGEEWNITIHPNPVGQIKLPPAGQFRERRATAEELQRLLDACARVRSTWLPTLIRLAIETGMRRGELLDLRWSNVDLQVCTVRLTKAKNGHPRIVPLSSLAVRLLSGAPRTDERVFPVTANAFRLAWERLRRRAGVTGLRFHDFRHEAVSRFFERGLSMPEVAAISGHRDARMLMRYAHPRPEAIAQKLG
jgi:integrase